MPTKFRRVVTGHDASGKAIVIMDGESKNTRVRESSGIASTVFWVTDGVPADNSGDADAADRSVGIPPPDNGSIFRIVEFLPEKDSPTDASNEAVLKEMGLGSGEAAAAPARHPGMHRTRTIDYAVVLTGEIDMLLDDSEVHLKPGDVVIQRGTVHAWANRYDQPCTMAFVLIDAKEL